MIRPLPVLGALALVGLLVTPPSLFGSDGPGSEPFTGRVEVTPVSLSPIESSGGRVSLRFATALSGGASIGGLSALHVSEANGGVRLLALSDTGEAVRIDGVDGRAAVLSTRLTPLPQAREDGRGKSDRDSESLALTDEHAWVGFENRNELRRYSADLSRLTGRYRSAAMADLAASSGLESLAVLPGGRLLGIAEQRRGDGRSPAFLWRLDRAGRIVGETPLWFRPPDGLRATDAVWLDEGEGEGGGRLLVLARGFAVPSGFHTALLIVSLSPTPGFGGQELTGRVIARFGPDWDNLEGLSLTRSGGQTTVWLVSDDNFSPLQRTLLIGLRLDGPG